MTAFNLFEICFFDINKNTLLTEKDITDNNKEIIPLLKYKEDLSDRIFHMGDIFYNKKTNLYYVFSFLKDKRLLNSNGVCGFGFYVFNEFDKSDFKLYYMKQFDDLFNLKLIDNKFNYVGNIFYKKNRFRKDETINHYINVKNLNNFYIYLKADNNSKYNYDYQLELINNVKFFVVKKIINVINFYFYIETYQRNRFNRETIDSYSFINGSLFLLNDYAKKIHQEDRTLFDYEISRNQNELNSVSSENRENILNYYDKLFIYLDKSGHIKYTSLNENNEKISESRKLIYIKNYLFDYITPIPFSKKEEKDIYVNALLSIID